MEAPDEPPLKHAKRLQHPDQKFIWAGDKDLKKLQKKVWDLGWWPEPKNGGAIAWLQPNTGEFVIIHGTESDHHAFKNTRGRFRRLGLDL